MQQLTTEPALPAYRRTARLQRHRHAWDPGDRRTRRAGQLRLRARRHRWHLGRGQRRALRHPPQGHRGHRVPRSRRPGHRGRDRGQPARYLPGVVPAGRRRSRSADRRV